MVDGDEGDQETDRREGDVDEECRRHETRGERERDTVDDALIRRLDEVVRSKLGSQRCDVDRPVLEPGPGFTGDGEHYDRADRVPRVQRNEQQLLEWQASPEQV